MCKHMYVCVWVRPSLEFHSVCVSVLLRLAGRSTGALGGTFNTTWVTFYGRTYVSVYSRSLCVCVCECVVAAVFCVHLDLALPFVCCFVFVFVLVFFFLFFPTCLTFLYADRAATTKKTKKSVFQFYYFHLRAFVFIAGSSHENICDSICMHLNKYFNK